MSDLKNIGVVVTGAGSGLGRGLALALAGQNSRVAVLDLDGPSADSTRALIERLPAKAMSLGVDVTDEHAVEDAIARCAAELGGIDLLVNNAGVLSVSSVLRMPLVEWRRVLEVNATGVFLVSRAVARSMIEAGRPGSIISIASIAGKTGDQGLAHYSASKFAVVGFTQALAKELAPHDITVNAVCPGVVETSMIEELSAGWDSSLDALLDAQCIKRPQTPEDIAAAVTFLHRCRSITGQAINVDGGTVFH